MIVGQYPATRLRRLRTSPWIRSLVSETEIRAQDLIWPVFVREESSPAEISGMPGVLRLTIPELLTAAREAERLQIATIALFPFTPPHLRTPDGREATNPDNLICRAIRALKAAHINVGVMTDVALDPYTDHGHDGVLIKDTVDNDTTVAILKAQALVQAEAGADILAPSDMMDGRIGVIREHLDQHGMQDRLLVSYAVKFASGFYGPFRQAVGVENLKGPKDKKTYQLNPGNINEALREAAQDIQEGADMIIIKPGLPYLDVISRIKQSFHIPVIAYQVSGEYAMIKAAAANGWLDENKALLETMIAFKRAGATSIITYAAPDIARLIQGQHIADQDMSA